MTQSICGELLQHCQCIQFSFLQLRKNGRNVGLSMANRCKSSYNLAPRYTLVFTPLRVNTFQKGNKFKVGLDSMIEIKTGLDLPIKGSPKQEVGDSQAVTHVALIGSDYP